MEKLEARINHPNILEEMARNKDYPLWKGSHMFDKSKLEGRHAIYNLYLTVRHSWIDGRYIVSLVIPPLNLEVCEEVDETFSYSAVSQSEVLKRLVYRIRQEVNERPYA